MLGRIPSAVGYQPTLATDMGTMQERITTTQKGSITSVQVLAFWQISIVCHYNISSVSFAEINMQNSLQCFDTIGRVTGRASGL